MSCGKSLQSAEGKPLMQCFVRYLNSNVTEVGDYRMVYRTLFHGFHTAYCCR